MNPQPAEAFRQQLLLQKARFHTQKAASIFYSVEFALALGASPYGISDIRNRYAESFRFHTKTAQNLIQEYVISKMEES